MAAKATVVPLYPAVNLGLMSRLRLPPASPLFPPMLVLSIVRLHDAYQQTHKVRWEETIDAPYDSYNRRRDWCLGRYPGRGTAAGRTSSTTDDPLWRAHYSRGSQESDGGCRSGGDEEQLAASNRHRG